MRSTRSTSISQTASSARPTSGGSSRKNPREMQFGLRVAFWLFLFMLMWGISGWYLGMPEPLTNFIERISDPDGPYGERPGDIVLEWLPHLHFGRWRDPVWGPWFQGRVGRRRPGPRDHVCYRIDHVVKPIVHQRRTTPNRR